MAVVNSKDRFSHDLAQIRVSFKVKRIPGTDQIIHGPLHDKSNDFDFAVKHADREDYE